LQQAKLNTNKAFGTKQWFGGWFFLLLLFAIPGQKKEVHVFDLRVKFR